MVCITRVAQVWIRWSSCGAAMESGTCVRYNSLTLQSLLKRLGHRQPHRLHTCELPIVCQVNWVKTLTLCHALNCLGMARLSSKERAGKTGMSI